MFAALLYMAQSSENWCGSIWREKRESNEEALDTIGEKRTLLNNILRRKSNWIDQILRRKCLLHDAIEGER